MKITSTNIDGVAVVENNPFTDHRGSLTRLFCGHELANIVGDRHIAQINRSRTIAVGAVRGLHYQRSPHAEMKLVLCSKGKVWDVAVDLRRGSGTFLQWHAVELSHGNCRMLVIPEGCAHGFQVLDPDSELLYMHTASYDSASEGGIQPSDPVLGISWPLPIVDLSQRDKTHPLLSRNFGGLAL
jgi:dTDP-4-dehydrorhamnose 3,5-epimerase